MTRTRQVQKVEPEGSGTGAKIAVILLLIVMGPAMLGTVGGVAVDLLVHYHILPESVLPAATQALVAIRSVYDLLPGIAAK